MILINCYIYSLMRRRVLFIRNHNASRVKEREKERKKKEKTDSYTPYVSVVRVERQRKEGTNKKVNYKTGIYLNG